jgi:ABC-2 type transport system ATP-binding protein
VQARFEAVGGYTWREKANQYLHGLGFVDADLDRELKTFSGGQLTRASLARALASEPDLLLLDEPTGGLDPLMQEEFLAFVAEERDRGATVFLSSHELDEVERVCDRIGIIREGRLIAVEHVADVTRRSFRHVALEFSGPVDAQEFERLPGVSELGCEGKRLAFKFAGDVDALVKLAARHSLTDVELVRPTLEEVFLTYYGRDGGA